MITVPFIEHIVTCIYAAACSGLVGLAHPAWLYAHDNELERLPMDLWHHGMLRSKLLAYAWNLAGAFLIRKFQVGSLHHRSST